MLVVQKFGGTSVANADRIRRVAEHISRAVKNGDSVVCVVSAMAGETDRLLKLGSAAAAADVSPSAQIEERELDALVATGEMTTAALVSIALNSMGVEAVSLNAMQIRVVTDQNHQRAKIRAIETERIKAELQKGRVVIVAGFQGVAENGDLTTIGRGGSDTSAVALAASLDADCCEIYSDVDGLFTADPNICKSAKKIDRTSYEELLETAGAGAKVIHMHSVELAARHNIDLRLKKSPSIDAAAEKMTGTLVTSEDVSMEKVLVSTVTHTSNEAKLSMRNVPHKIGIAANIFEPLAAANINVDMIVQSQNSSSTSDISFTIAKADLKRAMQITDYVAKEIGAGKVEAAGDVTKISIVGIGMRSHAGVAAKMFETLAKENIDVQMISTSEIKVSVVVDAKQQNRAVEALHRAFLEK